MGCQHLTTTVKSAPSDADSWSLSNLSNLHDEKKNAVLLFINTKQRTPFVDIASKKHIVCNPFNWHASSSYSSSYSSLHYKSWLLNHSHPWSFVKCLAQVPITFFTICQKPIITDQHRNLHLVLPSTTCNLRAWVLRHRWHPLWCQMMKLKLTLTLNHYYSWRLLDLSMRIQSQPFTRINHFCIIW